MAKLALGIVALAAVPASLAFRNTSPVILYSTAELLVPGDDGEVALAQDVRSNIEVSLKTCPTKNYILVMQEGVSSDDFANDRAAPHLARRLGGQDSTIRSTMVVPEVTQSNERWPTANSIERHCMDAGKGKPTIVDKVFRAPPSSNRAARLLEYDVQLDELLANEATAQDYTVIYVTTPPTDEQANAVLEDHQSYEMEHPFDGGMQTELKRDLSARPRAASSSQGGLFERYQYFTPGIFLAFFAVIPILSIIFVGLKALTSLEVSYFAFSKEMGPAAQRKQ